MSSTWTLKVQDTQSWQKTNAILGQGVDLIVEIEDALKHFQLITYYLDKIESLSKKSNYWPLLSIN